MLKKTKEYIRKLSNLRYVLKGIERHSNQIQVGLLQVLSYIFFQVLPRTNCTVMLLDKTIRSTHIG
jgi:hypothetical protein